MSSLHTTHSAVPLPPPWRYFAKMKCGDVVHLRGGFVGEARWLDVIRADLKGFDQYVHLNPSVGRGVRPVEAEMVGWQTVLLDADPLRGNEILPAEAVCDELTRGAAHLLGLPDLTPAWIDTGRGAQVWLLFPVQAPPPVWAARATRLFLSELSAVLGQPGWKLDVGNSDLTRLGRLPGSVNSKTGRLAVTLRAGQLDGRIPGALERWAEPVPDLVQAPVEGVPGALWGMFLPYITRSAALFLSEGAAFGGRHDAACKAAYSLRDYGCPEVEILAALHFGNNLCDEPLAGAEILRVWHTTRRNR